MKGLLVASAVLVGLVVAPQAAAGTTTSCLSGTVVVSVTQNIVNDAAVGLRGNEWAQRAYQRQIVVRRLDGRTFCASIRDSGSFSTVSGASPGATGFVSGGIIGQYGGGFVTTTFQAKFAPLAPTSGFIGTYDYGCDSWLICPGSVDWRNLYFTNISDFGFSWESEMFATATNGYWVQRTLGTFGDIVG